MIIIELNTDLINKADKSTAAIILFNSKMDPIEVPDVILT